MMRSKEFYVINEIETFILSLHTIEKSLLVSLLIYGVGFGVSNTWYRLVYWFSTKILTQGTLGQFLDATFYIGIVYFSYLFYR